MGEVPVRRQAACHRQVRGVSGLQPPHEPADVFVCVCVCVCVAHSLFLRCGRSIPWPPGGPGNIFCLPDAPGRRKLLMAEQRRWHPDSFQRLLASAGEPRPRDAELARIQTRAAAVARALNTELSAVSADPP